ncbi:unnamed protein product [Orchesella dallaii]|uniref:Uncharacterized protein n=1 Tax=Orchesella dallaii TaxID=48710 RepID=A0ABP1R634_9HEXA
MAFSTICKILLLSSIFILLPSTNGDPSKLPPNIQVALLIPEHEGYKHIFSNLYPVIKRLLQDLNPYYVEKQVAVATFNRTCLQFHNNFTSNPDDFSELYIFVHGKKSKSHHEHALQAIHQAVTSKEIGWSSSDVRKTLMIVTAGKLFLDSSERTPTCERPTDLGQNTGRSEELWDDIEDTKTEILILSESIQVCQYPPWLVGWMKEMGLKTIRFTVSPFRLQNGTSILPPLIDYLEGESSDDNNSTGPGISGRSLSSNSTSTTNDSDTNTCEIFDNLPIRTQVAFVIDRRQKFQQYFEAFSSQFEGIIQDIKKFNAEAEFALTAFTHYCCFQYPYGVLKSGIDLQTHGKTSKANCYKLEQKFTSDLGQLKATMDKMKGETPKQLLMGKESSAQTAVLFTATDPTIGWRWVPWDQDNNFIRRIIIFLTNSLTDIPASLFCDSKHRHEPRGDGSDTCDNSHPPEASLVGHVLKDKNVHIVAVVPDKLYDVWEDQLKIGMAMHDAILISVKKEALDGLKEELVEKVKSIVSCDLLDADPPGYNTLGL